MYKWFSGLLSGASSTLHCTGANSHHFIMFCQNWHPSQTSALWLSRLSVDLGFHQTRISGLQACRSNPASMTWWKLQRAQKQGHRHKVQFSAVARFLGSPHGRGRRSRRCCCTRMHHRRKCPAGAACKAAFVCTNTPSTLLLQLQCPQCLTFQLLETALNDWQGRCFHWNVF